MLLICLTSLSFSARAECEAEILNWGRSEPTVAQAFIDGLNQRLKRAVEAKNPSLLDSDEAANRSELGRIPAGAYKTMRECEAAAYQRTREFIKQELAKAETQKAAQKSQKVALDQQSGNQRTGPDNQIVYGPNQKTCLKRGMSTDGRITYTNQCKERVAFGYCNLNAKDVHDGSVCKARDSEFSRTGHTYVSQEVGLEPGATHELAYRYKSQTVFAVACINSLPLIESFNTPQITMTSKFQSACWRFKNNKK